MFSWIFSFLFDTMYLDWSIVYIEGTQDIIMFILFSDKKIFSFFFLSSVMRHFISIWVFEHPNIRMLTLMGKTIFIFILCSKLIFCRGVIFHLFLPVISFVVCLNGLQTVWSQTRNAQNVGPNFDPNRFKDTLIAL